MMDFLAFILLKVANALLIPVILFLFYFFIYSILQLGGLVAEMMSRRKNNPPFQNILANLKYSANFQIKIEDIKANFGLPQRAFKVILAGPQIVDKYLNDLQLYSERTLNLLNMGIRLGPVLGLAGTLIPLGPALLGLSSGNVAVLSSKLVVAFTTTVMGLFIGGLCYVIYTVRMQWYTQDLSDIEYIYMRLYQS